MVLSLDLLGAAGTALLAAGAVFGSSSNLFTFMAAVPWTTFGPHFVLLTFMALVVAIGGLYRVAGRLATMATIVAAIALMASTFITARILWTTFEAGGSVNPIAALRFGSMSGGPPDAHEVYTNAAGRLLEAFVYRPKDAVGPAPTMLYIHGGGWTSGEPDGNSGDLRWFADQGWLVVSVGYRLATESDATWDKAPQDVACALVWVTQNAASFGGDPQQIVVAGDSAGGNLAVNLAYGAASGQAESGCGGTVPVPLAVIVQYPVVDPQYAYDHGFGVGDFKPKSFIAEYIGGTPDELPERMRAISSATYISADAPPTLVIEPEKDGLIPSKSVYRFVEQARKAGVDITLVRIPFANHAYDQMRAQSIGNQARRTITREYLEERGFVARSR